MTRYARLAPTSFGSTFATLCGAVLGAAVLAAPAQAAVIGFDGWYGPVSHGESYQESGYTFGFDANKAGADSSNAVGYFVDGSDPWICDIACPVNNNGMYYGALNDSLVRIRSDSLNPFRLQSLDASFIGHTTALGGYPATAGLLRAQGFRADGTSATITMNLDGPSSDGFEFGTYNLGAFGTMDFMEIALFGFVCNVSGNCSAFGTNQGQFAIDNLQLANAAEVPEPATGLIFGLGMLGLAATARRRNRHANA